MDANRYALEVIASPPVFPGVASPVLSDETLHRRLAAIIQRMQEQKIAQLIIYADKEHGSNFEYLAGFIPRFEEALLVVNQQGALTYIMGNENLKLVPFARNPGRCLHAPLFSLPNQPMRGEQPLDQLLNEAGIVAGERTGLVGWKLFTGRQQGMCDLPQFVYAAAAQATGSDALLVNATGLFISPDNGARCVNCADEVAFYEAGANLASTAMLAALDSVEPGNTEKALGAQLNAEGQPNTVMTIAATGDRFAHARLYPSDKQLVTGDKLSLTTGYKGGLTSRSAYVVSEASELQCNVSDWLTRLAIPYYHAVVSWLEDLHIGMTGGELYSLIESVLPKAEYGWHLNPGHLVADEEWLSSPVYPDSAVTLKSGMLLQIDIIPSVPGYGGCSIEDTVGLADAALRDELARAYPDVWQRMTQRKTYLAEVLRIRLPEEVILLSNTVGYLRPFLLDKRRALVRQ
ncbi:M24 family metallopeptidase [Pantoea eucalypti]|uniref:M24 family metallopeptidase n=1 Tax=Pantoea eucalypti TaxID=470933 RepID=A0ABY2ZQ84_9GAMM|nr:M24 family metallopeptidase [Pantoea eucalypti]QGF27087.1 M24 family metallopeptidase [Pantoea eucalypti]TPV41882.1 M24 family metallopeptidase [Pantoea eucalypti]